MGLLQLAYDQPRAPIRSCEESYRGPDHLEEVGLSILYAFRSWRL